MNDQPESWMDRAACATIAPDAWFPDAGKPSPDAKRVCTTICPVREQCLTFGLKFDQPGIFGGTSQHERRQMRSAAA